jgi:hypothetical protein
MRILVFATAVVLLASRGDKGGSDPCAGMHKPGMAPKCGPVRTKMKLVKKEIDCEVPVYKCVVVCGCKAASDPSK